mgnify:FL=1
MGSERSYTGSMASYRFFRAKVVGLAGVQMKAEVGEVNGAGTVVSLALIDGEHPAVVLRHDRTVDLRHITSVDSAPVDPESLTAWWWREAEAWCIRHGGIGYKDRAACLAEMKRLRGA